MAAGRGASIFNFTSSLVQLRKEYPSLLWGGLRSSLDVTSVSVGFVVFFFALKSRLGY